MSDLPPVNEPKRLYELSWAYSQDAKVAVDIATGLLVDSNPVAVALTGSSRTELIGMEVTMLHPEAERELVAVEFRKPLIAAGASFRFTHPA